MKPATGARTLARAAARGLPSMGLGECLIGAANAGLAGRLVRAELAPLPA